jgi:hypothetical protein
MRNRNWRPVWFLVAAVTVAAGVLSLALTPATTSADSESEIQQGFAITPVDLNLRGKNPALVRLGSYIINAQGGCNDCHTCPSYNPENNPYVLGPPGEINAENYLAGGVPFGPFVSRNITPGVQGKPAGHPYGRRSRLSRISVAGHALAHLQKHD